MPKVSYACPQRLRHFNVVAKKFELNLTSFIPAGCYIMSINKVSPKQGSEQITYNSNLWITGRLVNRFSTVLLTEDVHALHNITG